MVSWIAEYAGAVILIAVLLALVICAVFSLIKDKKHPSGGCTGNCAACKMGCTQKGENP